MRLRWIARDRASARRMLTDSMHRRRSQTLPSSARTSTAGDVVRVLVAPGDTVAEGSAGPRARDRQGDDRGAVERRRHGQGRPGQAGRQGQGRPGDADRRRRRPTRRQAGDRRQAAKPRRSAAEQPAAGGEAGRRSRRAAARRGCAGAQAEAAARSAANRSRPTANRRTTEPAEERAGGSRAARSRSAARSSTSAAARAAPQAAAPRRSRTPARAGRPAPPAAARRCGGSRASSASTSAACRHRPRAAASASRTCRRTCGARCRRRRRRRRPPASRRCPTSRKWGEVERKPMSNIRRKTAEHLGHAWTAIPHVTQHDKADITALEALRKQYAPAGGAGRRQADGDGDRAEDRRGRAAPVPAVQRVARHRRAARSSTRSTSTSASPSTPSAACSCRSSATSTGRASSSSSAELREARPRRRAPASCRSTRCRAAAFTITNLGGIGGTSFTPIVNWPEVAILGISRASARSRSTNGRQFEPRLMLPLSLSYDHRVIDGADAARFLRWVAEAFEQPFVLTATVTCSATAVPVDVHSARALHCAPCTSDMHYSCHDSVVVIGAGPGRLRGRVLRGRSAACRSRCRSRSRIPAASASTAAASRRRRCCTSPTLINEAAHAERLGRRVRRRRRSTSTSCAASRTRSSTQLTGGLGQLVEAAQDQLRPGHGAFRDARTLEIDAATATTARR